MAPTFDGLFTHRGSGPAVVLYDDDGTSVSISLKVEFPCSSSPVIVMKLNTRLSYGSSLLYMCDFEDFVWKEVRG